MGWFDVGAIDDCPPGSACDQEIWGDIAFGMDQVLDVGGVLETEQVLDIAYEAVRSHSQDPAVSPALVAYAVVRMAKALGSRSVVESGLLGAAVDWVLMRQGAYGLADTPRQATPVQRVEIDFDQPVAADRPKQRGGVGLPGVQLTDLDGYPGFREPTAEEQASWEGMSAYLRERDEELAQYSLTRSLQKSVLDLDGFIGLLGADDGSNPAALERIAFIQAGLEQAREAVDDLLEHRLDADGDGVADALDACPQTCARGMDADSDGCIDSACGLREQVRSAEMRWLARLVLGLRAQLACCFEQRGRGRAAAAQLRAFDRQARLFERRGLVEAEVAERLRRYAHNARRAVLGDLSGLDCPAGGGT